MVTDLRITATQFCLCRLRAPDLNPPMSNRSLVSVRRFSIIKTLCVACIALAGSMQVCLLPSRPSEMVVSICHSVGKKTLRRNLSERVTIIDLPPALRHVCFPNRADVSSKSILSSYYFVRTFTIGLFLVRLDVQSRGRKSGSPMGLSLLDRTVGCADTRPTSKLNCEWFGLFPPLLFLLRSPTQLSNIETSSHCRKVRYGHLFCYPRPSPDSLWGARKRDPSELPIFL
jgi:hypothetical protein